MHKPLQLVVPVPTHAAKRECLELLDSLREKVEAGTIETLFVIMLFGFTHTDPIG